MGILKFKGYVYIPSKERGWLGEGFKYLWLVFLVHRGISVRVALINYEINIYILGTGRRGTQHLWNIITSVFGCSMWA
jgi:hypothetical protein